jgi:1-deoxyxylulose-5-phosphate synthase
MQYANLGNTGLKVSRICLGCMSYGEQNVGPSGQGPRWEWALGEEHARPFIRRALELGINFFDTANIYSYGSSEEILGRALHDFAKRDEVVIATKVHGAMRGDPNGRGLSRKAILTEIDASLRRLRTDYVDLYQIHRWDYDTPIEETLDALNEVVRSGKARYLGASSMYAWQFCKALALAERRGWARFVSMQNHYNLMYREEEREMMPLCRSEGVGLIPWSPLARGRLARAPDASAETQRTRTDRFAGVLYKSTEASDRETLGRLDALSRAHGVPHAQLALAWLLRKPGVTAPIVGATKMHHLDDAAAALAVQITDDEVRALEEAYVPHPIVGFS